jgi:hypothetical protein
MDVGKGNFLEIKNKFLARRFKVWLSLSSPSVKYWAFWPVTFHAPWEQGCMILTRFCSQHTSGFYMSVGNSVILKRHFSFVRSPTHSLVCRVDGL